RNCAVRTYAETLQGSAAGAVLLNGGGAAGPGQLSKEPGASCVGKVPVKGKLIGTVGESGLGCGGDSYGRDGRDGDGDGGGRSDQGAIAVESEGPGADVDRRSGAADVGGRNGHVVGPGVGGGVGIGERSLVGGAQRIVDGDLGGIGRADPASGIQVRGQAHVGGDSSGTDGSGSERERAESPAGVDNAIDGGVSEDLLTVGGFQQVVGANFEIAGACVTLYAVLLHHEEAIAVDGDIGVDPGGSDVTLSKVGGLGADLDARALLDGIAGAV